MRSGRTHDGRRGPSPVPNTAKSPRDSRFPRGPSWSSAPAGHEVLAPVRGGQKRRRPPFSLPYAETTKSPILPSRRTTKGRGSSSLRAGARVTKTLPAPRRWGRRSVPTGPRVPGKTLAIRCGRTYRESQQLEGAGSATPGRYAKSNPDRGGTAGERLWRSAAHDDGHSTLGILPGR